MMTPLELDLMADRIEERAMGFDHFSDRVAQRRDAQSLRDLAEQMRTTAQPEQAR